MKTIVLVLAVCLFAATARAQTPAPLTQAQNAFALDLYGKLRKQPGNLFFSPYSIATALGMVYIGARGETARQIATTLHLPTLAPPGADLRRAFLQDIKSQRSLADQQSDDFQFHAANALWGQSGYAFNPTYIAAIKSGFGGDLTQVDFTNASQAAGTINNWVGTQTLPRAKICRKNFSKRSCWNSTATDWSAAGAAAASRKMRNGSWHGRYPCGPKYFHGAMPDLNASGSGVERPSATRTQVAVHRPTGCEFWVASCNAKKELRPISPIAV